MQLHHCDEKSCDSPVWRTCLGSFLRAVLEAGLQRLGAELSAVFEKVVALCFVSASNSAVVFFASQAGSSFAQLLIGRVVLGPDSGGSCWRVWQSSVEIFASETSSFSAIVVPDLGRLSAGMQELAR